MSSSLGSKKSLVLSKRVAPMGPRGQRELRVPLDQQGRLEQLGPLEPLELREQPELREAASLRQQVPLTASCRDVSTSMRLQRRCPPRSWELRRKRLRHSQPQPTCQMATSFTSA